MQPKLNKLTSKKIRFTLEEKFVSDSGSLSKKMFDRKIAVEFLKQCGDVFFHEDMPVSLNIEIRTANRINPQEKLIKFVSKMPIATDVASVIARALVGSAYTSVRQVAELYVSKYHGIEDRIVVEIERL